MRTDLTAANFRLLEEGKEIEDFDVRCPDLRQHCCISAALVVDKGKSMRYGSPTALSLAQECLTAFIDAMDPDGSDCDEATIFGFDTLPRRRVGMMNDKVLLKLGIDGLTAGGDSRIWDGITAGLEELVANGTQECRAAILLTDGNDNSSSATADDVIALAMNNKIRVFTIGLGANVNETELQRIADDTGGKYYQAPQPGVLAVIYKEISTIIGGGYWECEINYASPCRDGSLRHVDLTLMKLFGCPGSDTRTKTFRPPRDTAGFAPVLFILPSDTVQSDGYFSSPVRMASPTGSPIPPFDLGILYDTTRLTYAGFDAGGCILDTVASAVTRFADTIRIRTSEFISAPSVPPLLNLNFLSHATETEIMTTLTPGGATPVAGCIAPTFLPGNIVILPSIAGDFPAGGSLLFGGVTYLLRWKLRNSFVVDLELSRDGGQTFQRIAAGLGTDSLLWGVPIDLPSGFGYRFRTKGADGRYNFVGDGNFTIDQPPRIVEEPEDTALCLGGSAEFHARTDSSLHSPVQWQKSDDRGSTWKNISGGTSDTLRFRASTASDIGSLFRALYFSPFSRRESRVAKLSLDYAPELFHPPAEQAVCAGKVAGFEVHPTATPTSAIQWQSSSNGVDWIDILGGNGEKLSLQNVQPALNGTRYRAIISNACGSITSPDAGLTVLMPPEIRSQPQSRIVREGDFVTLSLSASGANLHYLWIKDSALLEDRNGPELSFAPIRREDAGTYRAVVRGYCGSKLYSDSAVIVVEPATAVRSLPTFQDMRFSSSYPNPFSSSVSIGIFSAPGSRVELRICDLHGRLIRSLFADRLEAGEHLFTWDGRNDAGIRMAPGVYCAVLAIDGKSSVRKLTLVQ